MEQLVLELSSLLASRVPDDIPKLLHRHRLVVIGAVTGVGVDHKFAIETHKQLLQLVKQDLLHGTYVVHHPYE